MTVASPAGVRMGEGPACGRREARVVDVDGEIRRVEPNLRVRGRDGRAARSAARCVLPVIHPGPATDFEIVLAAGRDGHVGAVDGEALAAGGVDDVPAVGVAEGSVERLGIGARRGHDGADRQLAAKEVVEVAVRPAQDEPVFVTGLNGEVRRAGVVEAVRRGRAADLWAGVDEVRRGNDGGATDDDCVEASRDVEPRMEAGPVIRHGDRPVGARRGGEAPGPGLSVVADDRDVVGELGVPGQRSSRRRGTCRPSRRPTRRRCCPSVRTTRSTPRAPASAGV